MNRRSYALTLAACSAGAALSAYAVTRTWSLQLTPRTGMSDLRTVRTGADAEPWVIGLALVALAGTGALLATRGVARRVLGAVLALAGLGVAVGAILGRTGVDPGAAGAGATVWPIACVLGGLIIAAGGLTAARLGGRWPTMSARYDRRPATAPPQRRPSPADPALAPADPALAPADPALAPADPARADSARAPADPARADSARAPADLARADSARAPADLARADPARAPADPDLAPADHRAAWDALDRGDDPTT